METIETPNSNPQEPKEKRNSRDSGTRRALNKKIIQKMVRQIAELLDADAREPKMTHRERVNYFNTAARLGRLLSERDKVRMRPARPSPFD